jgi:glutaredoxin
VKQGWDVEYRNVKQNPADLEEMLRHSSGTRQVPVILREGKVEVGWMGKG